MKSIKIKHILLMTLILLSGKSFSQKFPIPRKTYKLLFYLQRNYNSNTIIYDAIFDSKGQLVDNKPIDVYWRRYEEGGGRMELRTVEKKFAFSIYSKKVKDGFFECELVAYDKRKVFLKQLAPYKAVVYVKINGKMSILDHLYIYGSDSWWPKVEYIELFGKDPKTGEKKYEKIRLDN